MSYITEHYRPTLPWLYGLAAFVMLLVFTKPFQPLWYDENYTLLLFVSNGPGRILFDFHVPNNHLLYSLGLWAWRSLVGTDLVASRFFSLALTALAIPGLMLAGRALGRWQAGVLAAVMFCVSHIVGGFSAQLRGYGPSMGLIALAFGFGALWWRNGYSRWLSSGLPFVICGALAIGVLMTNIIFVGLIAAWIILSKWPVTKSDKLIAFGTALLPLLGLLTYAGMSFPLLQYYLTQKHLSTTTYQDFISGTTGGIFFYDQVWGLPLIITGFILVRRTGAARWYGILAGLSALALLAPLGGHAPPPRIYVPLVPIVSFLAAWALWEGYCRYVKERHVREWVILPILLIVLMAFLREQVLAFTAESRWAHAHGAPQTLVDQYYNDPRYNPQGISALLYSDPSPKIIFAPKNISFEVPAIGFDNNALKIKIACWIQNGNYECYTLPGAPVDPMERLTVLVIHYDEQAAKQALGMASSPDVYEWNSLLGPTGYYKVWRLE